MHGLVGRHVFKPNRTVHAYNNVHENVRREGDCAKVGSLKFKVVRRVNVPRNQVRDLSFLLSFLSSRIDFLIF